MDENVLTSVLVVGNPDKGGVPLLQVASVPDFHSEIFHARNMKEAMKVVLKNRIDVIVVDYTLEDGDALELMEALHHLSARVIPTVVLAEENEEKFGFSVFRKGAKDFLLKDKGGHYLQRLPYVLSKIIREETRYREGARFRKNSEAVLASISDGIIGISPEKVITFANPVAAMYLDQPFESLMGTSLETHASRIGPGFSQALAENMQKVRTTNQPQMMGQYLLVLGSTGDQCLTQVSLIPVFDEWLHVEGYVLSFRDIADMDSSLSKKPTELVKDPLTKQLNRRGFLHQLDYALAYCHRYQTQCAVLYADLDGFKNINDTWGREAGNELLLKVSERIASVIRDSDVLARVGADEFMILLPHVSHAHDASKAAVKIHRALSPSFEIRGSKHFVTASIGISLYPNDTTDAEKLMQYADFAMTLAKRRGKNHFQYYQSDLNEQAERNIRLANDLRMAIRRRELKVYFHPQVSAKTGGLTGVEALLRWRHPEFGMIPPSVFIPIAENINFIEAIGRWVFKQVCEYCVLWQNEGFEHFKISINLSVKELERETLVDDILACLQQYPIEPSRFEFEITESIFVRDTRLMIERLHQLKESGFFIAMDDFGTGYSCLSYLKDLPIDLIKIDRSFVQSLSFKHHARHKAIVATIIDLAKRLHIVTLAEGVETQAQADYLRTLGCEHLQGFLFAKPMPFQKMTQFIRKNYKALPTSIVKKINKR